MRSPIVLYLSWGVNIALGTLLFMREYYTPPQVDQQLVITNIVSTNKGKPYLVVRRKPFYWGEIESEDYPTYIARLRAIGCPEGTIRDIIVADVNQLYRRRYTSEVITADQQWWKSDPDIEITQAAADKMDALEKERRELLTQLLGPSWDTAEKSAGAQEHGIILNGPVLGSMPLETKESVEKISLDSRDRMQSYLDACQKNGTEPDPKMVAQIRQESRDALTRILTPDQLQEYLLRYSHVADEMRQEFRGFEVTPDEFRRIFSQREQIDLKIEQSYSGNDPNSVRQRELLEQQRSAIYDQVLTPERAGLFRLQQDPGFQQVQTLAQNLGAPNEAIVPLYQLNQLAQEEFQRIQNDTSMTDEERNQAMRDLQDEREMMMEDILGSDLYQQYLEQQNEESQPSPLPR